MRISRSVMAVGGVVVAAAAIGFMDPKAVQAVTAALVQVTNTAANPVVSSEVTLGAGSIVDLYCVAGRSLCRQIAPGGYFVALDNYVVPAGKVLVITNIEIHAPKDAGASTFVIGTVGENVAGGASPQYVVADDGVTHEFNLGPGFVWPSGGAILSTVGTENLVAVVRGYLTNN